jgi:hypothetical protein
MPGYMNYKFDDDKNLMMQRRPAEGARGSV